MPADPPRDLPPENQPLPVPDAGLGRLFVSGMIWGTLGLVVAKASSLVATLCLGWIFGSTEYGVYGAAMGAAMVGEILTDGGLRRVLITRGAEYAQIARTAFRVALVFNLVGGGLILAAGAAYLGKRPEAFWPLATTAVALVLSSFATIQKCRQSIDMHFRQIAFMGTTSAIVRNIATVVLAWWFMRVLKAPFYAPLAFALPLIVVNLWEIAYVRRTVGHVPAGTYDAALARQLVGQGKWVIFAMLGSSLVYRGDYFVSSNVLPLNLTGQYVWAFQFVVALFSPFSIGMTALIQPIMARLQDDPLRQSNAFLRMVRIATFVAVPASVAAVLVTPILVHSFFPHRPEWHACVLAIQILAATECVRQLHHLSMATLDARGQFHRSALLVTLDGVGVLIAALIGCYIGTLNALMTAVAIERTLTALFQAVHTYRQTGGSAYRALIQISPPIALAAPLTLAAMLFVPRIAADAPTQRLILAAMTVPVLVVYAVLSRLFTPIRFAEASDLLLSRLKRPKSVAP